MNAAVHVETDQFIVEGPHAIAEVAATGEPLGALEWVTVGNGETCLIKVSALPELIAALQRVLEASQ